MEDPRVSMKSSNSSSLCSMDRKLGCRYAFWMNWRYSSSVAWRNSGRIPTLRMLNVFLRDYCGNSFHPELIGSALGEDQVLRQWVDGVITARAGEVASKNTVFQVYTHLCQEVEQLSHKQGLKLGTQLIKDLPVYPDPCDPQRRVAAPRIHDVTIHGPRTPKQTKHERYQFCCNQAAVHHLGVPLSQLLRNSGLEICFDAFRAPVICNVSIRRLYPLPLWVPGQPASSMHCRTRAELTCGKSDPSSLSEA